MTPNMILEPSDHDTPIRLKNGTTAPNYRRCQAAHRNQLVRVYTDFTDLHAPIHICMELLGGPIIDSTARFEHGMVCYLHPGLVALQKLFIDLCFRVCIPSGTKQCMAESLRAGSASKEHAHSTLGSTLIDWDVTSDPG
jgi:hypothetical protein